MPVDIATREATVTVLTRRLRDAEALGAQYPKGYEPRLHVEHVAHLKAKLLTAERLLANHLRD